jgi:hypothetical protein
VHDACPQWRKQTPSLCLFSQYDGRSDSRIGTRSLEVRHLQYCTIAPCRPPPVYNRYHSDRDRPLHVYLVIDCWQAVNAFDSLCKAIHRSNGLRVSSSPKFQGDTHLVHQRTASRPSRSTHETEQLDALSCIASQAPQTSYKNEKLR